jgi:peptide deformylase
MDNIFKIINHTESLLHTKIAEFDFKEPPVDPVELAQKLISTMNHHNGIGLSANQCGLPYRVFVMKTEPEIACFNPKIVSVSQEVVALEEGCLTYPFLYVKIKRPSMIRVRYTDQYGEIKTDKFIGITARCFQHEYDHLEGINYLRRANLVHVERAKRNQYKIQKRLKAVPKTINEQAV